MREFYIVTKEHRVNKEDEVIRPVRGTSKSAGYDFHTREDIVIKGDGGSCKVPLDIGAVMEDDEFLDLRLRSSVGLKQPGVFLTNSAAIVDSDYAHNPKNDGNITLSIFNISGSTLTIKKGERIAQGVFVKYLKTDFDKAEGVRDGGFGSTGKF